MVIIPEHCKSPVSPAVFIKRLTAGALLINLFVIALIGLSLRQSRLQHEEQAAVTTQNLAQVLEQNISGSFDKIDVVLLAAVEEFEHQFAKGIDRQELEIFLSRLSARLPELDRLSMINAQGEIAYGAGLTCGALKSAADRDYFKHLRDNPRAGLFISRPMVSRISGKWVLVLARRVNLADGSFAGVVCGVIPLEHFRKLFTSIDVGKHGAISLRDGEMGVIARFPEPLGVGSTVGQKKVSREVRDLFKSGRNSGTYKTLAPVDKIERTYTSRRFSGYPLSIHVGLATEDYLAEWWGEVAKMSTAAVFFMLITLFASRLIHRYINERKRTEEELLLTQLCVDKAAIGIYDVAEDGSIRSVNDYACRSLGYSKEELCTMNVLDIDPAITVERHLEIKRYPDVYGYATHESTHRRKDGTTFPVEITTNVVKFHGKEYPFSFVKDISERKQAEAGITHSEQKFRAIFESARDAIFLIAGDSTYIDCNPAATELFGCAKEHVLGKNPQFFSPPLQPDGRETEEKARGIIDAALEGEPQCFEWRHRRRDGAEFDAMVVLSRFELEGEPMLVAIVRDISERKRMENELRLSTVRFRELSDMMPEVIFESDLTGRLTYANKDAFTKYGYPEEELVSGIYISQLVVPEERDRLRNAIEAKLTGKDPKPFAAEYTTMRKDGSTIPVIVYSKPIYNEWKPVGLRGIVVDISERIRLEEQLYHSQKMEAVGQLAGGVAHDFNNIITAIIGFAHLISMKMTDGDPSRKYLDQITVSAERAAELTQGLLAFSRKQIIAPKAVDLNELVVELKKMLRRLIRESIELRLEVSPGIPIVMADRGKIEQVLMNLATNARDAITDTGTITIKTSAFNMTDRFRQTHGFGKPGNYACIAVTDNGCGMNEETKRKIFEPFFTTKELGKGTGLGLSIVYGIIKQHNGYVLVDSEPGKGATFKIYLPLADGHHDSACSPQGDSLPFHGEEMILLAEDDATLNDLHKALLEGAGYSVITAADGEEAVEKFQEHKSEIALLVLDVIMPKMNGKQVFELIRIAEPEIAALFVSGYPADVLYEADMALEEFPILMKPITPNELLRKVRETLDGSHGE